MDSNPYALQDQIAIVTGASKGIGRATAKLLAEFGATVVVADIDEEGGNETVDQIETEIEDSAASFIPTDVSDSADVSSLIEATVDTYGGLDILVNNAGGSFDDSNPHRIDDETWNRIIDVNLTGQFRCAREAIPAMAASGGGAFVHVSSVNATQGIGLAAYSAAKNGVIALSRLIATQYGQHGIRSNVVAPGSIITDASSEKLTTEGPVRQEWLNQYPTGHFGTPEDVATAIHFLASPAAAFISGTELLVDGGLTAGPDQHLEEMMYDISEL
ncbi:3-oxoacyl-ACP reductase [Haloprofundus marisrubri]|uniref:3-oxoacyl-ACP reductase n=1 Tax=Haloprofundus marisrubri TaxID=1514971 RepID=A0A0W1RD15_9EURY|nr:SDR family NAD(P)-dependent oxidoreductase [Haloprofundus marisrubri]KTG11466.1 3-oxoacyl-ACP reductase [Haloprofundus marisrubri]